MDSKVIVRRINEEIKVGRILVEKDAQQNIY
jgi:hypothetical protein